MNTNGFICFLSHHEMNLDLALSLRAPDGLDVQTRFLKEGLPDGNCRSLVVDLDSVAPGRVALQRLVKELIGRPHPYPVAVFGYNLEDDQIRALRAAGILVFPHCLVPEVFEAIAEQLSDTPCEALNGFVWLLSDDEVNQYLAAGMGAACALNVLTRFPEEGLPDRDCLGLVVDLDSLAPSDLLVG
jgi:hypothetical protein